MIRNLIILICGLSFAAANEDASPKLVAGFDRTVESRSVSHAVVNRNLALTPQCQTEMTRINQFITYNTDIFACDLVSSACVVSGSTITCDWDKTLSGNEDLRQQCASAGGVYTTTIFTADVTPGPLQPYSLFVFNNYGVCLGDPSICTNPGDILLDLEMDFETTFTVVITCAGSPSCGGNGTPFPSASPTASPTRSFTNQGGKSPKSAKSAKATSVKSAKAVSAKAKSAKSAKAI